VVGPTRASIVQHYNLSRGYYDRVAYRYGSALFFTVRDCLEVSPTISYKGPKFMVFTVLYKSDGGGGFEDFYMKNKKQKQNSSIFPYMNT